MIFDTHAHYDDDRFQEDRFELLAAMPERGVGAIVNPGCTLESSRMAIELAERYPFVHAAVGFHPENCHDYCPEQLEELKKLAMHPKVVAIGEVGLDYYWPENPSREVQQRCFRDMLALARELGKPVIVHDREAHKDSLDIIREFPEVTGVFHCYSGSLEDAKTLVKLGWYLGFNGAVTFKNAKKAPEVAAWVPTDRLLVETDAPYLAPVPHRGKRCDSAMIAHVLDFLASIRPESREELERITWENAVRFYRL